MLFYATFTNFNLPQNLVTLKEVKVKENIECILHEIKNEKEYQQKRKKL